MRIAPTQKIYKDKHRQEQLRRNLIIARDKNGKTFKDILAEMMKD